MTPLEKLTAAAAQVHVIDVAGRILDNPQRNAASTSTAEVMALAYGFEKAWAIALEADLLARAVQLPMFSGNLERDEARDHAIEQQAEIVRSLMAEIRGETDTNTGEA